MASSDMPPPLEDMTHALQARKRRLEEEANAVKAREVAAAKAAHAKSVAYAGRLDVPDESDSGPSLLKELAPKPKPKVQNGGKSTSSDSASDAPDSKSKKKKKQSRGGGMFGGLSGGFLSGGKRTNKKKTNKKKKAQQSQSQSQSQKTNSSRVPISVVPNANAQQHNPLQLDEVQQAMGDKPSFNMTTPDMLEKVQKNERLMKGLANPRFTKAIEEMQKDPAATVAKYADDVEMGEFFKEFMELMGIQLGKQATEIAKQHDSKIEIHQEPSISAAATATTAPQRRNVDPAVLQKWMSDPKIYDILNDPRTSQILAEMDKNPSTFPKHIRNPRILTLVRAGIVPIPPQFQNRS
jgi:STI1/HOP, DP domain